MNVDKIFLVHDKNANALNNNILHDFVNINMSFIRIRP
jgi:hypothetical protein